MIIKSPAPSLDVPAIKPLPTAFKRPFWSVMITTYKRTDYLEKALKSIIEQNIDEYEMQIEVVDDCSPPETAQKIAQIVQEVGKGRVNFYRQPKNMGIYGNWNTCINRAGGYWIHILSDDDVIMPNFYQAYRQQIEAGQYSMVIGQSVFIDKQDQWIGISKPLQTSGGLLDNALKILSLNNPISTPAVIVAREAYEKFGGFTNSLVYAPDWEMWTRLAASAKVGYVERPYSQFRRHQGSETGRLVLNANSVTDSLAALKIIKSRFDNIQDRQEVELSVKKWLSKISLFGSHRLVAQGYCYSAWLHALWVLRLTPSISSLRNMIWILLKILKSFLNRPLYSN